MDVPGDAAVTLLNEPCTRTVRLTVIGDREIVFDWMNRMDEIVVGIVNPVDHSQK
jgi:hypothetical protein